MVMNENIKKNETYCWDNICELNARQEADGVESIENQTIIALRGNGFSKERSINREQ